MNEALNSTFHETEQYVPMPDGTRLDLSACVPQGDTPNGGFPVVIVAHGHGDNTGKASTIEQARHLAARGYVAVTYSVRGQGASEGLSHTMSVQELYDLQEIITWTLENLTVDRRKLGVMGRSQGGWHAYMAAAHDSRVACIIAENAPSDFTQMALPNGCMRSWWYLMTMRRKILTAGYPDVIRRWTATDRWDLVREWTRVRSPLFRAHEIRCPTLILQGWHDEPLPVNQAHWIWDRIDAPKQMFLGVGGHGHPETPEEAETRLGIQDEWLDRWLKTDADRDEKTSQVDYVVANTLERRTAESFPPPEVRTQDWYLQPDGGLTQQLPDAVAPPSSVRNRSFDKNYDLPAAINDDFARTPVVIEQDQIAFESAPADSALTITGTPEFTLHVESDSPWLQLNLTLSDIAPDGSDSYITRANVGMRNVEPGQHLTAEFEGVAICYRLQAGHKLRLVVSNTSFPVIIPYYEEFLCRVFHERKLPSRLSLPISRD